MELGYDKSAKNEVSEKNINTANNNKAIKQKIDVNKPVLIKSESTSNKKILDNESKEVMLSDEKEVKEDKKIDTTAPYELGVNNIINGVLDTITAEINNISISKDTTGRAISANVSWNTNHKTISSSAKDIFVSKYTLNPSSDTYSNSNVQILEEKNKENPDVVSAYNFLLENTISLVLSAGDFEKKITIAAAHRDSDKNLVYTILTSNDISSKYLFVEGEENPVTISNIPNDSLKLINDLNLIVELKRLDTGRTFRINLSQYPL
jgi:hypothetical protein